MKKKLFVGFVMLILCVGYAEAQTGAVKKIIEMGQTDNQVMDHLDVLCNRIGGRVIGSNAYDNAVQWVASKFKEWGLEVEERKISVDELFDAATDGSLEEVFGTGTAAVISPVGHLRFADKVLKVQDGGIGEISQKLYDTITGIQLGKIEDNRGWVVEC